MTCRRAAQQLRGEPQLLQPQAGVGGVSDLRLKRFYAQGIDEAVSFPGMDVIFGMDDEPWGLVTLRVHFSPLDDGLTGPYPHWAMGVQVQSLKQHKHDASSGGVERLRFHDTCLYSTTGRGYFNSGFEETNPDYRELMVLVPTRNLLSWLFRAGESLRVTQDEVFAEIAKSQRWGLEAIIAPESEILRIIGVRRDDLSRYRGDDGSIIRHFYGSGGDSVGTPLDFIFGLEDVNWGLVYVRVHYQYTDNGTSGPYTNTNLMMQLISTRSSRYGDSIGDVSATSPYNMVLFKTDEIGYSEPGSSSLGRYPRDFVFNVQRDNLLGYLFQAGDQIRLFEHDVRENMTWGIEVGVAPEAAILALAGVV